MPKPTVFTVTVFRDEQAQTKASERLTLEELGELISTTTADTKDDLPWLKLATFGDKKTDSECLRHDANLIAISGVELDYDAKAMSFTKAVAIAKTAKLKALFYTSPSYTPKAPKWHIVLPTSEELPPKEREKLVARVNGLYGGIFDDHASFTLSQSHHYGRVNNNPAHRVKITKGDYIDRRADLDSGALGKNKKKANGRADIYEQFKPPIDVEQRLRDMEYEGKGDRGIHCTQLSVTAALLNRGEDIDVVIARVLKETRRVGKNEWDWDEEERELRKICETWAEKHPPPEQDAEIVCAADVKMKPKKWLWKGHLLCGALELLTGLPGLGKSQVQIHFVACVTTTRQWPDGAPPLNAAMNVIMVTAEDALETEVIPRLTAAGADLKRTFILKYIKTDPETKRQFLLAEDLERLEKRVTKIGNVGLVTIDPITAYMGGRIDSHKTTEVRSQLGPLKDFAERTGLAISAVTHPPKSSSAKAIDHFIGSQAFIAAARIGHVCTPEMLDGVKTGRALFTHAKHNPSKEMPTLAFKVESAFVITDEALQIETSFVVWANEAVDISADEAIAAAKTGKDAPKPVVLFLQATLKDGPRKYTEIVELATAHGFSEKQLRAAREKLKIVFIPKGFGKKRYVLWELPRDAPHY